MQSYRRSATLYLILLLLLAGCAPGATLESSATVTVQAAVVDLTAQASTAQVAVATVVAGTLQAQPTATTRPSPTPLPTPQPEETAAPPAPPANPHYTLNLDLSYAARAGSVDQRIVYPNNTGKPMDELRLVVALYDYHGAFTLKGLWWLGGARDGQPVADFTRDQPQQLLIALPQPLLPGEQVGLRLSYDFSLPAQASLRGDRPVPLGHTPRQLNLVDWYPYIPPYRAATGWIAPPPSFYGEHLTFDLADFEVNLRLLDPRQDLTVAASTLPDSEGETLVYHRKNARNFVFSIGHDYRMASERVGQVTVTSYYFPAHTKAGERVLQTTVEALKLFEELFGPYPYNSLAVVEADFLDGMEYDGLYFLSRAFYNLHDGKVEDYLVAIAAHETAHMWWYGLIANDQAHEPWLDEALSTYSELLYYERYYPEALNWWWQYRIKYENPRGWIDSSVYGPKGSSQNYLQYRAAVYLNGAVFFADLRELMGDEAFFAFLRDYAGQYTGQIATAADFFALLRQHTAEDLSPLLERYFAEPIP